MSSYGNNWFTGPLMNALQARAFIDDLRYKKELREREREQWSLELEERKRNRALQDFQTQMILENMGATQADEPSTVTMPRSMPIFGGGTFNVPGGRTVNTPVGQYRMPTAYQKRAKTLADAELTGEVEGITEAAKAEGKERGMRASGKLMKVKFPAIGDQPEAEGWIPREGYAAHIKAMRELKAGKYVSPTIKTDEQTGQSVFMAIDSDTGRPVEMAFSTQMTPKAPTGAKEELPSNAEVEALIRDWRQNAYNQAGITQADIDAAGGKLPDTMLDEEKMKARKDAQDRIDKVEKNLRDTATDEIKARIRKRGADPAFSAATEKPKEVDAKALPDLLTRARAKEPTLTMDELRRRLAANGIKIKGLHPFVSATGK